MRSRISRAAKTLFFCFVLIEFVIIPLSHFFASGIAMRRPFQIYEMVRFVIYFVRLIGMVCLLAFGVVLAVVGERKPKRASGKEESEASGIPAASPVGPSWRTSDFNARQKHRTMRRREWAYLIDMVPLFLGLVIYGIVEAATVSVQSPAVLIAVLAFVLNAVYMSVKDAIYGVSVGKFFMNCRVVDNETGRPCSVGFGMIRNLPLIIPPMAVVEFAFMLIRKDHRRMMDLVANTTVVSGPPNFINGIEQPLEAEVIEELAKHPLD